MQTVQVDFSPLSVWSFPSVACACGNIALKSNTDQGVHSGGWGVKGAGYIFTDMEKTLKNKFFYSHNTCVTLHKKHQGFKCHGGHLAPEIFWNVPVVNVEYK